MHHIFARNGTEQNGTEQKKTEQKKTEQKKIGNRTKENRTTENRKQNKTGNRTKQETKQNMKQNRTGNNTEQETKQNVKQNRTERNRTKQSRRIKRRVSLPISVVFTVHKACTTHHGCLCFIPLPHGRSTQRGLRGLHGLSEFGGRQRFSCKRCCAQSRTGASEFDTNYPLLEQDDTTLLRPRLLARSEVFPTHRNTIQHHLTVLATFLLCVWDGVSRNTRRDMVHPPSTPETYIMALSGIKTSHIAVYSGACRTHRHYVRGRTPHDTMTNSSSKAVKEIGHQPYILGRLHALANQGQPIRQWL